MDRENGATDKSLGDSVDYELRFWALFKTLDQGVCVIDVYFDSDARAVDYRFLEINPAFEDMTGLQNAAGRTARELVPDLEEFWFETYGRVAMTGEPIRFESHSVPMGRWFNVHASRLGGDDSRKVLIVFTNITAQKRSENEYKELADRNFQILESITDCFFAVDNDWRFTYVNRQAAQVLERDEGELLGKVLWEEYPGLAGTEIERAYLHAAGELLPATVTSYDPDHDRWYEIRAYPASTGITVYFLNVTERRKAEEEVMESQARLDQQARIFDTTLSSITDFAYTFDRDGRFTYVNKPLLDLWGLGLKDAVGKNFYDLNYPTDLAERLQTQIQQVFDTGVVVRDETPYTSPTGAGGFYEYIFNPVSGPDGVVSIVAGSTRDITARNRLEGNLAFLAEISKDLTQLTGIDEIMKIVGEKVGKYLHLSVCAVVEINQEEDWAESKHSWNRADVPSLAGTYHLHKFLSEEFQKAARAGDAFVVTDTQNDPRTNPERYAALKIGSFLSVPLLRGGEWRCLLINYRSEPHDWQPDEVYLTNELATRIWTTLERARAEDELNRLAEQLEHRVAERTAELAVVNEDLRAENLERLRVEEERVRILNQLVTAQEDARRRIGRDLHDQLGQQVTALRLKLEAILVKCRGDQDLSDEVEKAKEFARKIDEDVSFLAMELRPVALDDLGLVAAVDHFIKEWSQNHNIRANFHPGELARERLSSEVEINIYRVVQEALNNILKHAKANSVSVLLELRENNLVLIVEDDGGGFDADADVDAGERQGLGLTGMRERCLLLGGSLDVESSPGEGTVLCVRVPVNKEGLWASADHRI